MKGQVYILTTILVLIILVLVGVITTLETSENFLYENFLDLKNELTETVDLSLLNQEDLAINLDEFIVFSKDIYSKKGFIEDVTYTIAVAGDTTVINIDLYLGTDNSFIQDNFIITRTVYT